MQPQQGLMTWFTSGVENLHGALPVQEAEENSSSDPSSSRRLALAMWYVTTNDSEEGVPEYGAAQNNAEEDDPNRAELFQIPVDSIKVGSLRLALGLYLAGQQNSPTQGSWRANQGSDNSLHMIFKDETAMVSITLKETAIIVSRHADGIHRPSLPYQLQ